MSNISTAIFLNKSLDKIKYIDSLLDIYYKINNSLFNGNFNNSISLGFDFDNLSMLKGAFSEDNQNILNITNNQDIIDNTIIFNEINNIISENVFLYGHIVLKTNAQIDFVTNLISNNKMMYSDPDMRIQYIGDDILLYNVVIGIEKNNGSNHKYKIILVENKKCYDNLLHINDIKLVDILIYDFMKEIKVLEDTKIKMYNQYYNVINKWIKLDIWGDNFTDYWNILNSGKMPIDLKTYININFNMGLI